MNTVKIAVDVMGGDRGMEVTMPAVKAFLSKNPDARLVLVGDRERIEGSVSELEIPGDRVEIKHASEVVDMDEPPQLALKKKRDSSMRVAIDLIRDGEAKVAVSAGNTGALMATAKYVLKTLPGVHRPAIAKFLPGPDPDRHVLALDLGANMDSPPEHLVEFAIVGSHFSGVLNDSGEKPRVGLLNVGSEDIKGTGSVKAAHSMLKDTGLNFKGNIEADAIFSGDYDVVVCDGFVGNIVLKNIEGVIGFLGGALKEEFTRSWASKLAALVSRPVFRGMRRRFDPRRYNGALFLGLRGMVLKSHGGTDEVGFEHALREALRYAELDIMAKFERSVADDLEAFAAYRKAKAAEAEAAEAAANGNAAASPAPEPEKSSGPAPEKEAEIGSEKGSEKGPEAG